MTEKETQDTGQRYRWWRNPWSWAVTAAVAVGAFFRLYELGLSALRADTITFWNICRNTSGPGQIFREWMQLMGISGQFPFPCAATKWFLSVTGLDLTFATLRLPSALWGTAAVAAAYFVGRELRDRRVGLLAALTAAVSPFLIQISREAYYYPPLVLGSYLMLWASLRAAAVAEGRAGSGPGLAAGTVAGFFLLTWSQPTGWVLSLLGAAAVLVALGIRDYRRGKPGLDTAAVVAGYVVVGIPLLVAPWGMRHLIANASGPTKEAALKALAVSGRGLGDLLYDFLTIPAWGGTLPRLAVSGLLAAAGLACLARGLRREWKDRLLAMLFVGGLLLYLLFRSITGAQYAVRYLCALIPVYLLVLSCGLDYLYLRVRGLLGRWRPAAGPALAALLPAVLLGMQIHPAWLCTRLTGKPTPYRDIVRWCDSHLPAGTLVLVDRWFEPWNELKVHASTNVFFTFTVPNEPVDVFLKNDWRRTAREFFARNPGAAYLEIAKEYWQVPEVGPWEWPRRYFHRHHAITNEAGLALRRMHLANREDFYAPNTNRVVVEIFYDRPEDVADRWRAEGRRWGVLFGPGWKYTKSQDYRDWRVFQRRAALLLMNLSDQPQRLFIEIRGAAYGGSKNVRLGPKLGHVFPAGKMDTWRAGPVLLPPGNTLAELRDDLWNVSHIPLLVESVRLVAPPAAESR